MTVRQLFYTSCARGRDGGAGFQVNAATPGIGRDDEDAAIRASSYRPPSALLARAEPDPDAFPLAFGYARSGRTAIVFQSRYVGRDFVGRQGNYFAHALLCDDPETDLDGLLPIDLWRAPIWVHAPRDRAELAVVDRLRPGGVIGPAVTAGFAAGHRRTLLTVLTAVGAALAGTGPAVILVCEDPGQAALWISALTRSLPAPHALATTFTTYTTCPDATDVVVAATTPDVAIRPGGRTVLDLTAREDAARERPASPYARAVGELWRGGDRAVGAAMALLGRALLPDDLEELDRFAGVLGLLAHPPDPAPDHTAGPDPGELGQLARTIQVIVTRSGLLAHPWGWAGIWTRLRTRLAVQDPSGGEPGTAPGADPSGVQATGELLQAVAGTGVAVPAEVIDAYAVSVLRLLLSGAAPVTGAWLPALERPRWRELLRQACGTPRDAPVLPRDGAVVQALDRCAPVQLRAALAATLPASPGQQLRLAGELPWEVVPLLAPVAEPNSPAERIVAIVRARHGQGDPVDVADRLVTQYLGRDDPVLGRDDPVLGRDDPAVPARLSPAQVVGAVLDLLWPHGVSPQAGLALLSRWRTRPAALHALARRCLDGLVREARSGTLGPVHAQVAEQVLRRLPDPARTGQVARAVKAGFDLPAAMDRLSAEELTTMAASAGRVGPEVGGWLRERLADALLSVPDATRHHHLLQAAVQAPGTGLLETYTARARDRGPLVPLPELARWAGVWALLAGPQRRQELWDGVLPAVLTARRRGDVEALGKVLHRPPGDLLLLSRKVTGTSDALASRWRTWLGDHPEAARSPWWAGLPRPGDVAFWRRG